MEAIALASREACNADLANDLSAIRVESRRFLPIVRDEIVGPVVVSYLESKSLCINYAG